MDMVALRLEIDYDADAAYVTLFDREVAVTREIDRYRILDYDAAGQVIGIEFLNISGGVSLDPTGCR